ncbi:hypothetical protein HNY73_003268 [Argiope bruennichi]|uniref:Uncharacterized protein n=1 Tax=Argiope bruennichi TaxID=94029 RepID=A0A8T0FYY8_ARGBR|nr:hypothetical protein HNY73_003268 [Argiope bruennichi]
MSSNDESSSTDMESEEDRSEFASHHRHKKRFSLVEISTRYLVTKIMRFRTRCSILPSSWEVEINLEKDNWFENFTISITLKRTDSGRFPIEGFLQVFLSNFEDKVCPVSYCIYQKMPYFETLESNGTREATVKWPVSEHYKCLFLEGSQMFQHDMLLIKTLLSVRSCCGCCDLRDEKLMKRGE